MMHLLKTGLATLSLFACGAQAHEFWIEPADYAPDAGAEVQATFHVGQSFKGPSFIFLPDRSAGFDMLVRDEVTPVNATLGDNPAFSLPDAPGGLLVIAHETTDSTLRYKAWADFQAFADHKAFGDVAAAQDARGLPRDGFEESYRRFAKALVGVGDAAGSDRAFGLRTEIVARANPYTDDLTGGLPVLVLLEGAPRVDAQVEMFARAPDGTVTTTLHRTDADGIAVLPVRRGHAYLVDAVTLLPLPATDVPGPVWQTLWAALTFAVP
jgi:cobalt/nickel transport protein